MTFDLCDVFILKNCVFDECYVSDVSSCLNIGHIRLSGKKPSSCQLGFWFSDLVTISILVKNRKNWSPKLVTLANKQSQHQALSAHWLVDTGSLLCQYVYAGMP